MHICFDAWKHCHMQACNQLRLNMCISKSNAQICLFSFLCSSSSSQESPEKKSKASNELEKSKNFAKLRRFDLLQLLWKSQLFQNISGEWHTAKPFASISRSLRLTLTLTSAPVWKILKIDTCSEGLKTCDFYYFESGWTTQEIFCMFIEKEAPNSA